jgi:hypothetical protein
MKDVLDHLKLRLAQGFGCPAQMCIFNLRKDELFAEDSVRIFYKTYHLHTFA